MQKTFTALPIVAPEFDSNQLSVFLPDNIKAVIQCPLQRQHARPQAL